MTLGTRMSARSDRQDATATIAAEVQGLEQWVEGRERYAGSVISEADQVTSTLHPERVVSRRRPRS